MEQVQVTDLFNIRFRNQRGVQGWGSEMGG